MLEISPTWPMFGRLMGLYAACLAAGFVLKALGRSIFPAHASAMAGGPGIARKFNAFFIFQTLILSAAFWSTPALAVFFALLFGLAAKEIFHLRSAKYFEGYRFLPVPAFGILFLLGLALLSILGFAVRRGDTGAGLPVAGMPFLALLLLLVAVCDGYSQICGQLAGGPKIVPRISPGKTWGGFAGGLVFGALASWLGNYVVHPFLPAGAALGLGAGVGMLAFLGDISASWVKRRHGIKDFSNLLGPQGGALDRADSLLWLGPALGLAAWVIPNP